MSRSTAAPAVEAYAGAEDPATLHALDAAVAARPADVALRRERAEALASLLRYADAERELRHAVRLDERDVLSLSALGALLCRGVSRRVAACSAGRRAFGGGRSCPAAGGGAGVDRPALLRRPLGAGPGGGRGRRARARRCGGEVRRDRARRGGGGVA